MVMTFKPFGRLGNRLFLFAHLLAFAEGYGVCVANRAFGMYRSNFRFFNKDKWCTYVPVGLKNDGQKARVTFPRLAGMLGIVPTVRFWDERDVVFDGSEEGDPRISIMRDAPSVIFEGWKFRSRTVIVRIMPRVREVFAPRADICDLVNNRVSEGKARGDLVVGVHVRLEDYRGTSQYFSPQEFAQELRKIEALFAPRKIAFIVCSQEQLDRSLFLSNSIVVPPVNAVADLYTLAACDYIMGPPSTFSGWASFYGGKPLFTMNHDRPITDPTQAEIVRW